MILYSIPISLTYTLALVDVLSNLTDSLLHTTGADGVSFTFAQLLVADATAPLKAVLVPSSSNKENLPVNI